MGSNTTSSRPDNPEEIRKSSGNLPATPAIGLPREARLYCFGGFTLDVARHQIHRRDDPGAAPIQLTNKPCQLLLFLIENSERMVSRQELLDRFWKGQEVYDDALRKAVGAIRKALVDSSDEPRFVETSWGNGYRFIAALDQAAGPEPAAAIELAAAPAPAIPGASAMPAAAVPAGAAPGRPAKIWSPLLLAAAGLCALVVTSSAFMLRPPPNPTAQADSGPNSAAMAESGDAAIRPLLERARHFRDQRAAAGMAPCVESFRQVLKFEPDNAEALEGIAGCLRLSLWIVEDSPEAEKRSTDAAVEAVKHNPRSANARAELASVYVREHNDRAAEIEFRQALSLDPNNADVHHTYSLFLNIIGAGDAAIAEARRAVELAPGSLPYLTDVGFAYRVARRYDEALRVLHQVLEQDPGFAEAHGYVADILFLQHDCQGAEREAGIGLSIEPTVKGDTPDTSVSKAFDALCTGDVAQIQRWRETFAADAAPQRVRPHSRYWLATLDAQLGDREQAMDELLQAQREHAIALLNLPIDPYLDPLRGDPRFQAIQDSILGGSPDRMALSIDALRIGENTIRHFAENPAKLAAAGIDPATVQTLAYGGGRGALKR